ncbi:hypothetical protein VTP01DRAFT_5122 [Rhizomucor pusillus]|uniref:uncharacterized protein n=1 Tax=Rhizomucor pusillus TaxID=4840 RepID=UPI003742F24A
MLLTQQTNYLRLNKCILHSLLKSTRDNDTVKRSLAILAMDWRGPHGYLYELKSIDDVYCARLVQALCMPKSLDQLSKFWDTLKGLLSWKMHILGQVFRRWRSLNEIIHTESSSHRGTSPDTYFTPERPRKFRAVLNDL